MPIFLNQYYEFKKSQSAYLQTILERKLNDHLTS